MNFTLGLTLASINRPSIFTFYCSNVCFWTIMNISSQWHFPKAVNAWRTIKASGVLRNSLQRVRKQPSDFANRIFFLKDCIWFIIFFVSSMQFFRIHNHIFFNYFMTAILNLCIEETKNIYHSCKLQKMLVPNSVRINWILIIWLILYRFYCFWYVSYIDQFFYKYFHVEYSAGMKKENLPTMTMEWLRKQHLLGWISEKVIFVFQRNRIGSNWIF